MPVPFIDALITGRDTSEVVRDQIAAILLREVQNQRALALVAEPPEDPDEWMLRIFLERSNPWEEWLEDSPEDTFPIVNVWLDNVSYDPSGSNIVERQKATGVFNIDCYGYGVASDVIGGGHAPGDQGAAIECQRALRLCRRILMAGTYTYLGLQGYVWRRFTQSATFFQPQIDGRAVQQIQGARLALAVDFNEFSPQVHGPGLEALVAQVERRETGELYFTAQWGQESAPP